MKIFSVLFLIQFIIYIYFFKTVVKSLNLKIDLDDKRYTVLYDEKKVKFADLDLLKVMFHPNHVRHCSNSIINYMMKLSSGTSPYILFVVKNIDITFEKPLEYNDDYKIFGAITNYGNTSIKLTVFGIGSEKKNKSYSSAIDFFNVKKLLLDSYTSNNNYEVDENNKGIHNLLKNYNEEKSEPIKLTQQNAKELAEGKTCKIFFKAQYTLVKISKVGSKASVTEDFKNEYPAIDEEKLKELINLFC